jgi:hypothetical protein
MRRAVAAGMVGMMTTLVLTGCGGGGNKSVDPASIQGSDLMDSVLLTFSHASPSPSIRTYKVAKGRIINVQLTSDTAGDLVVTGYNLSQPVQPGSPTLLIVSGTTSGQFDVVLRAKDGEHQLAKLDVQN